MEVEEEEDLPVPPRKKAAGSSASDKAKKEEYYKMDAEKFQTALREAIGVIQTANKGKRAAGRHEVFFGDGSSVHLVMEQGAWNPKMMNWDKPTADKPVTLKQKLEELGLDIPERKPAGGYVTWARETLFGTEDFAKQLTAGERIAEQHGCFMLYGPVASPYFNPKENFYRFVKSRIRQANGPSLKQLEYILDECCKDTSLAERCKKWYKRAHGFRLWFAAHAGEAVVPPIERQIDQMLRWGLLDEAKESMETQVAEWMKSVSTTGHVPPFPHEVDAAKFREALRSLNVQRYKRGFEENEDKDEEDV